MNKSATIADVQIARPSLDEVLQIISFSGGFNTNVVISGTSFLGAAAGLIGCYAMLRKKSLMSDVLAHSALPGIALMFIMLNLLGYQPRNLGMLLFGATVSGVLGTVIVQLIVQHRRLKVDAAMSIVLSVFFGIGIVLLSYIQSLNTGSEGGLHHFIYGQTASMRYLDAIVIATVAIVILFLSVILIKEFALVCFDQEFAAVQGWPVQRIDLLMMSLVVAVTVVGLQSVGLILIIALVILPPASARFWTENLSKMILVSTMIGALSGFFGSAISALFPRMPAGAVIVLTASLFFVFSFFFAPRRGVISNLFRICSLRIRISKEHILRTIYESIENRRLVDLEVYPIQRETIKLFNKQGVLFNSFIFFLLKLSKLIEKNETGFHLTQEGYRRSAVLTRNHRLWEEYIHQYSVDAAHVDYSADIAEHVLSDELLEKLEKTLEERGVLPAELAEPQSIHPLG